MQRRKPSLLPAGDCVAVKDTHLVYRACSRQFATALGRASPEDIIGRSDFDLLPAEVARQQLALDSQIVVNGQPDISTLPIGDDMQVVVMRTPVMSAKRQVRGIDIRLVGSEPITRQPSSTGTDSGGINYQSLVDQGLQGSMVVLNDRAVFANQNAATILGYGSAGELIDLPSVATLFAREDWNQVESGQPSLHEKRATAYPERMHLRSVTPDEEEVHLLAKAQPISWQGGAAVLISFVDMATEELDATVQLETEQRYKHYAAASADFFWELDAQLKFSFVSEDIESILEMPVDAIIGKSHEELLQNVSNVNADDHWDAQVQRVKNHQPFRDFDFHWGQPGDPRTVRYSGIPIYDLDHTFLGYRGTGRDVTAANKLAESAAYHASHDALTGLVNRRHFELLTERALTKAREERAIHALCFMDLDSFKIVNDTCGHLAGDELLRQLSALLDSLVRKSDVLARLGGDEFGLLLYDCSVAVALKLANQIRSEVENFQFLWAETRFQVGVSIGLVVVDDRWENMQALFSAADSACYLAKDEGRNRVVVYREADGHNSNRKVETHWVEEINQALEEDRMLVARQVILPLSDLGDTSRFEMFMRLRSANGEIINPGAFLPSAERYGLSGKLDLVTIGLTLEWLKHHPRQLHNVKLCSLNLTSGVFGSTEAADELIELIDRSGVPASKLCFELTETATVANLSVASAFMQKMHETGCHFMLDDFGSGLSAFAYLKNLPVKYLKIDGLLVKDILDDPMDYTMVKAINEISQSLGMQTVAKYVETAELLEAVQAIGVDFVQGFHMGRPEIVSHR